MFQEQKSETGKQLEDSFHRLGILELVGNHGQTQSGGWFDGADTQKAMRPTVGFLNT